ncbi:MAG: DNA cytosine methyltransferase [Thiobacillus sp.]|nr:DNA cytosine methyltransferase [Thiobacillus sp.]
MTSTANSLLTAIDLYSGSGAVTEGLKHIGFNVLAAVDSDPVSCKTYRANHEKVHLYERDIREVSPADIRKDIRHKGNISLLIVCAPCQPFSTQNKKRFQDDPRAALVLQAIKFIKEFSPSLVFFENVPGIAANGPIDQLRRDLHTFGYSLGELRVIDAADCGVAQRRERCIMVAAKEQERIDLFYASIRSCESRNVADLIGHLPSLGSGERDASDPLHFARRHHQITLERLKHIPKNGGSRSSLPKRLQLKCHKGRDGDFPDVYGRMKWDDVAPTLTTGCTDLTKGRYVHPRDDRAITLREAALLQSFPPEYKFCGNSGQIARQIGNAVPVEMIKALELPFRRALEFSSPCRGRNGKS